MIGIAAPEGRQMILVIDDSDQERAVIRKILDEGLALFDVVRPALVLCDLMMPKKDGFDTVRDILKLAPEAKIVATSGVLFGFADHAAMAKKLGLAAVIEKPFRQAQLLEVVRSVLKSP
jgi:CheY-like chemotaxis protein